MMNDGMQTPDVRDGCGCVLIDNPQKGREIRDKESKLCGGRKGSGNDQDPKAGKVRSQEDQRRSIV